MEEERVKDENHGEQKTETDLENILLGELVHRPQNSTSQPYKSRILVKF